MSRRKITHTLVRWIDAAEYEAAGWLPSFDATPDGMWLRMEWGEPGEPVYPFTRAMAQQAVKEVNEVFGNPSDWEESDD